MRAMVLESTGAHLQLRDVPIPSPGPKQLQIRVEACAVCRTDLHILNRELIAPHLPLILGHQVIGTVSQIGAETKRFIIGQKVGIPWLSNTCHACSYCQTQRENLCDRAQFTGFHVNGGYAEFCVANEDYCYLLPDQYANAHGAPLLCGGLIGWRALQLAGRAQKIGFYGFGSSAHILIQISKYLGQEIYAFTRPGDTAAQDLARKLGAVWAGSSEENPPQALDSALVFASVGSLVPKALKTVSKGGSVVCLGIHMSDIPAFPYASLYGEKFCVPLPI